MDLHTFRYIKSDGFFGDRYLFHDSSDGYVDIKEVRVLGIADGSIPIDTRTLFKIAKLNNFLDKLKEMCSTDLNQKQ